MFLKPFPQFIIVIEVKIQSKELIWFFSTWEKIVVSRQGIDFRGSSMYWLGQKCPFWADIEEFSETQHTKSKIQRQIWILVILDFLIFLFSWAGLLRVWKSIKSNLRGVKSSFKVLLCLNWLIWRQSVSRFRNNILAETAPIEMLTEKNQFNFNFDFFVFFRNRYRNRYWNNMKKYLDWLFL